VGGICFLLYLRALAGGFVNFDDQEYILDNVAIRSMGSGLITWALTHHYAGFWMPLTWISFAIDYRFWGLNPWGYHLTNILLHAGNAGLVVLLADRLCRERFSRSEASAPGRFSYPMLLFLAGLLFGINPLRVESVAWVTERKDVLNGVFSLGSIILYLRYAQKKVAGEGGAAADYVASLVLFALSLMAKSVSVVLPLMLLVADWYPLGRWRKGTVLPLLVEKIPYFVLSAAMAVSTVLIAARVNSLSTDLSVAQRFIISGNAIFEYGRLLLYPAGIIPLFAIPDPIPAGYYLKAVLVAGVCILMFALRKRSWLPAVWLGFAIPLLPVLAFTQNGIQAFAARYTYLPSVVPSIAAATMFMMVYGKIAASPRPYLRFPAAGLLAALLVFYFVETERQIGFWRDSGALWTRQISRQPIERAYFLRGMFHLENGNYRAAVDDFSASLPMAAGERLPSIYARRGEASIKGGRYEEAVRDLCRAIELAPVPSYYYQRALAFRGLGRQREAADDFMRAGLKP
jgi:hypothetical protein